MVPVVLAPALLVIGDFIGSVHHHSPMVILREDMLLTIVRARAILKLRVDRPIRAARVELIRTGNRCDLARLCRAGVRRAKARGATPETAVEDGPEHGNVDGEDTDDRFADTPAVDVESRRASGDGKDDTYERCGDDEDTRGKQKTNDELPGELSVSC